MMRTVILGFCALVALTACDKQPVEQAEIVRPVHAIQIGTDETFSTRKFPGRAEASDSVTLAFEVPGKLQKILVDVGDVVKQGEVLAKLDPRDFQNTLAQAKAELKRSKAQFERMQTAAADNAVSKQDVSDAQAVFESAKAMVKIRQKALDDSHLVAPYDGTISAKFIKDFENVQAKQPAIRLVDTTRIEMVADIPEDLISLAEKGMEILVEFDAFTGVIITSKIHEIGTEASKDTRTFPVTLLMEQPKGITILPGMAGKAWRDEQNSSDGLDRENLPSHLRGFELPLSAILSLEQKSYVWVIDPDSNQVNRVEIKTGELTKNGVLVQGLSGNEFVATAGVNHLTQGQKVRIVQTKF